MRVFVTGATGFVGSAVVSELISRGHEVLGLARSAESADKLSKAGAAVQRGTLEDLASLREGAENADAVIHTGFNHDFSRFAQSCIEDRAAIEAIGDVLHGSTRKFLVTSGTAGLAYGRIATETDKAPAFSESYPRQSEAAATALAERGVHASIVRLPPSVHGEGDHGFVKFLIGIAQAKGVSGYVGDGANLWPAAHRLDVARLYCLALGHDHQGPFHAVAEEGLPVRLIAEKLGSRMGLPVVSIDPSNAPEHFGWFCGFAGADMGASSEWTRQVLDWMPEGPDLITDMDLDSYYAS